MAEFRMPSLGADMDVGTIIEWLVKPGDPVKRGQIVAVVDTAKAAIEIEAFQDGVFQEILVKPGVQVPVGTPLAIIGAPGEAPAAAPAAGPAAESRPEAAPVTVSPVPEAPARAVAAVPPLARIDHAAPEGVRASPPVRHLAHQLGVDLGSIRGSGADGHITHEDVLRAAQPGRAAAAAPAPPEPAPAAAAPVSAGARRLRITPRARRLAAERGIDLAEVTGSGAAGAVLAGDVERAVPTPPVGAPAAARAAAGGGPGAGGPVAPPSPAAPPAPAGTDKRAAMRAAIANLMARSNAEIPHYYVTQTMDLGPALAWLRAHNADLPARQRLIPSVLFLRATVLAALEVPDLNGHWVDGARRTAQRVDLGVAVATRGGGLVTPAIPDAGGLKIDDLMARLADLVSRARRGNLKQAEMAGASITVSALGENGPDALYGVIFPPQVALVGVGGIVERPWAVDGMLTVRPTVTIALAADHRASDGRTASAFLAVFAHALEHPEEL